jgi:hypothetical protein
MNLLGIYSEQNAEEAEEEFGDGDMKVDARLPGLGKSNSHGARPVHLIITMIQ